jgi:hypothetical protein
MLPPAASYVMCIDNTDYPVGLTLFKVYQSLPRRKSKPTGVLRVIDDSGEDYLFDADYFVPVTLPPESERAFVELTDRLNREWAEYLAQLPPDEDEIKEPFEQQSPKNVEKRS